MESRRKAGKMSIGIESCRADFAGRTNSTANKSGGYIKPSASRSENVQVIRDKINEMLEKIENGDIEPTYQIGGRSFTEREWDKLLAEIDAAEDTLKKLVEEEKERRLKADETRRINQEVIDREHEYSEIIKEDDSERVMEENIDLLTTDGVRITKTENDSKVMYVTAFGPDGIKCKKLGYIGEEGWLWEIPFNNGAERRRVLDFLEQFPKDANLVFVSQKEFWEDFLAGRINEEEYLRDYR